MPVTVRQDVLFVQSEEEEDASEDVHGEFGTRVGGMPCTIAWSCYPVEDG